MNQADIKNRNTYLCQLALDYPTFTLKQLRGISSYPINESNLAEILRAYGVRKKKGTKGFWYKGEKIVRPNPYVKVLNPKPRGKPKDPSSRTNHPLNPIYQNMLSRCYNPNRKDYKNWGGRGITVCDRWLGKDGFKNFLQDMGERPEVFYVKSGRAAYTLERNDNNLGYSPDNCDWAPYSIQNNNQREQQNGRTGDRELANKIRGLYLSGKTQKEISEELKVGRTYVCLIVNNKLWKDSNYTIPPPPPTSKFYWENKKAITAASCNQNQS